MCLWNVISLAIKVLSLYSIFFIFIYSIDQLLCFPQTLTFFNFWGLKTETGCPFLRHIDDIPNPKPATKCCAEQINKLN